VPVSAGSTVEHLCWAYDDPADFLTYAAEFLDSGISLDEDVWFLASGWSGPPTAPLGDAVRIVDLGAAYSAGDVIDPAAQVAAYAAATRAAVAAGYSGLRVAADVTELIRTPAQLDAFARYEFAINTLVRTAPFRAVCGYDRSRLGDAAVDELSTLHPQGNTGAFHLGAVGVGTGIVLTGELDATAEDLFATALNRAVTVVPGAPVVVHGEAVTFIDHRSLLVLERYARRHGTTAVLRVRYPAVHRLADLLGLGHVRVEVVA
jgi:anti-anti-sigma regulatory factor